MYYLKAAQKLNTPVPPLRISSFQCSTWRFARPHTPLHARALFPCTSQLISSSGPRLRSCAYDYDTQGVHVVQRMHAPRADKLQQPVKTVAHKKRTMCFANRVQARIIPFAVYRLPPRSVSPHLPLSLFCCRCAPPPPPNPASLFLELSCFLLGNIILSPHTPLCVSFTLPFCPHLWLSLSFCYLLQ